MWSGPKAFYDWRSEMIVCCARRCLRNSLIELQLSINITFTSIIQSAKRDIFSCLLRRPDLYTQATATLDSALCLVCSWSTDQAFLELIRSQVKISDLSSASPSPPSRP